MQAGGQDKVVALEDLALEVQRLKKQAKKVVQCHGVFDLLHVGHVRHLDEARRLGDALVVTVTPDRFVNKGPGRPAFPEQLRAEVIACLGAVHRVAINRWPTAVEAIKLLCPDVYAKGPDYSDPAKDVTGGIALEEQAVRSVGGRLATTADITFSSSALINRHFRMLPDEVLTYLREFESRHTAPEVVSYLRNARPLKVLVVGEAIVDEYQYSEALGKSSKEPMLAVRLLSTERFAGGILAVGNHVASFTDRVGLVSFLGDQGSHEDFIRSKLQPNIAPTFLRQHGAPTIVKRRFVDHYFFTKLLEVYEMNDSPLPPQDEDALCRALEATVADHDVVIVVDFGHGMIGPRAIEVLARRSKFLAVNAQANAGNHGYHAISRYPRADYISLAEKELRLEARDRHGDLRSMTRNLRSTIDCPRVAVTRGKHGCLVYDDEGGFVEAPALTEKVVDRIGAGDAFLSVTALCAAQGAPSDVLAFIGNAVGAQAVATVGNRSATDPIALAKHIETLLK